MKKTLLLLGSVLFVTALSAQTESVTIGDFTYNFYTSGNAYVEKYNGTDAEVTIPATITVEEATKNVTGIGSNAFAGNTTIEKLHMSRNTRYTLGKAAFKGCTALKVLNWSSESGATGSYIKDNFYYPFYDITESAFEGCTSITAVTTRYTNVTSVGANAFKGCTALKTCYIYASTIGANVFDGCTALTQVRFYTASSLDPNSLDGIPTTTKVLFGLGCLSDELINPVMSKSSQIFAYLPFSSSLGFIRLISCKSQINMDLTGVTAKYVKSVMETSEGVTVEVEDIPSTLKVLPANTALIVQYNGTSTSPYYTAKLVTDMGEQYVNYLQAVTSDIKIKSEGTTNYYRFKPKDKNDFTTFEKITEETSFAAGTGYLKVVNGQPIVTGIRNFNADVRNADAPTFNLAGQRVNGQVKGIVIKNGKKYVK